MAVGITEANLISPQGKQSSSGASAKGRDEVATPDQPTPAKDSSKKRVLKAAEKEEEKNPQTTEDADKVSFIKKNWKPESILGKRGL